MTYAELLAELRDLHLSERVIATFEQVVAQDVQTARRSAHPRDRRHCTEWTRAAWADAITKMLDNPDSVVDPNRRPVAWGLAIIIRNARRARDMARTAKWPITGGPT